MATAEIGVVFGQSFAPRREDRFRVGSGVVEADKGSKSVSTIVPGEAIYIGISPSTWKREVAQDAATGVPLAAQYEALATIPEWAVRTVNAAVALSMAAGAVGPNAIQRIAEGDQAFPHQNSADAHGANTAAHFDAVRAIQAGIAGAATQFLNACGLGQPNPDGGTGVPTARPKLTPTATPERTPTPPVVLLERAPSLDGAYASGDEAAIARYFEGLGAGLTCRTERAVCVTDPITIRPVTGTVPYDGFMIVQLQDRGQLPTDAFVVHGTDGRVYSQLAIALAKTGPDGQIITRSDGRIEATYFRAEVVWKNGRRTVLFTTTRTGAFAELGRVVFNPKTGRVESLELQFSGQAGGAVKVDASMLKQINFPLPKTSPEATATATPKPTERPKPTATRASTLAPTAEAWTGEIFHASTAKPNEVNFSLSPEESHVVDGGVDFGLASVGSGLTVISSQKVENGIYEYVFARMLLPSGVVTKFRVQKAYDWPDSGAWLDHDWLMNYGDDARQLIAGRTDVVLLVIANAYQVPADQIGAKWPEVYKKVYSLEPGLFKQLEAYFEKGTIPGGWSVDSDGVLDLRGKVAIH